MNKEQLIEPLSKEEFKEMFLKYKNGDEKSFEKLILSNIRLTLYLVQKYFPNAYDKEDLYSISFLSLINALKTFDIEKNISFSSYLTIIIKNDILMFYRKVQKYKDRELSYEEPVFNDKKESTKLIDTLEEDYDIALEYEKQETIEEIKKIVSQLPDKEKEIICLFFGFYNDKCYTQSEIAKKLHIGQASVSRTIKSSLEKIKNSLSGKKTTTKYTK